MTEHLDLVVFRLDSFMQILLLATSIVSSDVTVATDFILVDNKTLQSDRAAGMSLVR